VKASFWVTPVEGSIKSACCGTCVLLYSHVYKVVFVSLLQYFYLHLCCLKKSPVEEHKDLKMLYYPSLYLLKSHLWTVASILMYSSILPWPLFHFREIFKPDFFMCLLLLLSYNMLHHFLILFNVTTVVILYELWKPWNIYCGLLWMVFLIMMPCSLVVAYKHFRGT
jgi:hypothetical protein